mmetsp:Transcript_4183/g.9151  ORF Transcript_4183/g.9151 Transcript_4183/m.9151 type:complete len:97 (-) Transcript_4183:1910-2200(-)
MPCSHVSMHIIQATSTPFAPERELCLWHCCIKATRLSLRSSQALLQTLLQILLQTLLQTPPGPAAAHRPQSDCPLAICLQSLRDLPRIAQASAYHS